MQNRIVRVLAAVAGAGLVLAVAAYAYVTRPSPEASGEITAIPLDADLPAPEQVTEAPEATATQPEESQPSSALVTLELVQAESEARFIINEILAGVPTTVVGVTDQVAAQIIIDPTSPQSTQVGVVQINARTLATDREQRNRAIRNQILNVAEFEFITFTPTEIIGLPETAEVGQTLNFQIVGDLTIRHITQQVTFDATVTAESETRVVGLASATIQREDFQLVIPSVPQVAGVEESVVLELQFVAEAI